MDRVVSQYASLLSQIDGWFARCVELYPDRIACASGCSSCCRSLFDITLLDAFHLKLGFERLPISVQTTVLERCRLRLASMRELWPELQHPYLLNHRPDREWEALMPEADETPCVLLDQNGRCLVYGHRPMTCRLHGIPLVDLSGEVMHDEWCSMNFTGVDPLQLEGLRAPFDAIFRNEVALFRTFAERLVGQRVGELDTFIPLALLIDFKAFDWKQWFETFTPAQTD